MKSQRAGPTIYKKLIKARRVIASNSQHKWLQDCPHLDDETAVNSEFAFIIMAPKCTKSTGEYTLTNVTALGLRPDPHPKFALQLNYFFLLAR